MGHTLVQIQQQRHHWKPLVIYSYMERLSREVPLTNGLSRHDGAIWHHFQELHIHSLPGVFSVTAPTRRISGLPGDHLR
jgi:hypothetical protein